MTIEQQLMALKLPELKKMAEELGIKIAIRDRSRPQIIKKIRKKQIELAVDKSNQAETPAQPTELQSKPAFERLCIQPDNSGDDLGSEQAIEPPVDGRGGVRENAGRPQGLTDDFARADRALNNETADPTIVFLVDSLFSAWATAAKTKEIALSETESKTLALPITNYLILKNKKMSDALPPEAFIAIAGIMAVQSVVLPRIKMQYDKYKVKKDGRKNNTSSDGQAGERENSKGQQPLTAA